jgi:hypothetical protein
LFSSLHHMTMPLIQYIYTKQRFLIYFEYQKKTTMHTQHTFNDIYIYTYRNLWSLPDRDLVSTIDKYTSPLTCPSLCIVLIC